MADPYGVLRGTGNNFQDLRAFRASKRRFGLETWDFWGRRDASSADRSIGAVLLGIGGPLRTPTGRYHFNVAGSATRAVCKSYSEGSLNLAMRLLQALWPTVQVPI